MRAIKEASLITSLSIRKLKKRIKISSQDNLIQVLERIRMPIKLVLSKMISSQRIMLPKGKYSVKSKAIELLELPNHK
jgi:hypothetical protein